MNELRQSANTILVVLFLDEFFVFLLLVVCLVDVDSAASGIDVGVIDGADWPIEVILFFLLKVSCIFRAIIAFRIKRITSITPSRHAVVINPFIKKFYYLKLQ